MSNSVDFRADQIQTKQIIVTGSGAGTTKLLIYGIEAQGSPANEGIINTTYFPQDGIGGDVFLYVSGAVNAKGSATVRGTSVFGGDLVVSGSLYNGAVFGTGIAGDFSHAEGKETRAQGHYSHAEGTGSVTNANYSHAEGSGSLASGTGAHAEGFSTRASGYGSHAEGRFTNTDGGYYAHAEGYLTTASAYASHAEGQNTTAGSGGSHAEGFYTSTGGDYSHTEGYQTQTTGAYSHAQGSGSITWGIYSFAAGNRTIASGSVDVIQAAFGRFNKRENTTSLFVVGNGTGDSDALRGDIFRTESTGELVLSGGIRHKVSHKATSGAGTSFDMQRNDYLFMVDTNFDSGGVQLPYITNAVTDIGLTVKIKQIDAVSSGRTLVIYPNTSNIGYKISGFGNLIAAAVFLGTTPDTNTNRTITLTFMGTVLYSGSPNTWLVTDISAC